MAIRKDVRDPAAGLRGLLSRIALIAPNPASIPLRSIAGDSDAMAPRCRDCAFDKCAHRLRGGIGMKERLRLRCYFVRVCAYALLPGPHTTHIVRLVTRASFPP